METVFITFRSITAAQRGERILKDANLSPLLQRTPRWMQERGCGYSLRLRSSAAAQAVALLRHKGRQLVKVYAQNSDGQTQEMAL